MPPLIKRATEGTVNEDGLTNRQRLFVIEFIRCADAKKAAELAGYRNPGNTSAVLMNPDKYPNVARAIKEGIDRVKEKAIIDKEEIVRDLAQVSRFNIFDLLNDDGTLKPISEMPREVGKCIKKLKVSVSKKSRKVPGQGEEEAEEETTICAADIEAESRMEARKQLAQHFGINMDQPSSVDNSTTINNTNVIMNWGDLVSRPNTPSRIEERIARELASAPDPDIIESNGHGGD